MTRRCYRHGSPLPEAQGIGLGVQEDYQDSPDEQVRMRQAKGCGCKV